MTDKLTGISLVIGIFVTGVIPLTIAIFRFIKHINNLGTKLDNSSNELSNKMDLMNKDINNKLEKISDDVKDISKETTFNTMVNKSAKINKEVGWWKSDIEGKTVMVSQDLQDLVQYPEDKLMELGWLDFVHPQDRPRLIESYTTSLKTGVNFSEEFRWKLPTGRYMKVKAHTNEVYSKNIKIGYYGEMRKVTNDKTN
mgnify:CR=1 FL=1|jgi:PAS domain S-box-containing protein